MLAPQTHIRFHRDAATESFDSIFQWLAARQVSYDKKDFYGNTNSSAGAYQIKLRTWVETIEATGWGERFDKDIQTRVAIYRLQFRNKKGAIPRRSTLGYLMEGDIEKAISETNVADEWSWLPGGKEKSVKITMEDLKAKFLAYIEAMRK